MKKSMQQFPRMLGHVGIGLYTASVVTLSYFRSTEIKLHMNCLEVSWCFVVSKNIT